MPPNLFYKYARFGRVSFEVRQTIWERFREGIGVTNIRKQLRSDGIKIGNQSVSNIVREERQVTGRIRQVSRLAGNKRLTQRLIVKTPQVFGTRYMYRGSVLIREPATGEKHRVNLSFGDDRNLDGETQRERFLDIGERIAEKGGPNSDWENAELISVRLETVMEGGQII